MDSDFGIDLDDVFNVIDSAEVVVIRFSLIEKRLLVDARSSDVDSPLIKLVPRVGSAEERFRNLRQLRPRFAAPEKILSFLWPRRVETLVDAGVWQRLVERLAANWRDAEAACAAAYRDLLEEERTEVRSAITGGPNYQVIWERA
ncbi:MAG: hypothetical protein U0163_21450 [Gemmatimonadaceae bacterium]